MHRMSRDCVGRSKHRSGARVGSKPWSEDAALFQPNTDDQLLLPDHANCLSAQTILKMAGLQYNVKVRSNAEYMSPSGRLPLLHTGNLLISELSSIIEYITDIGKALGKDLSGPEIADMQAYISLIQNQLGSALLQYTWVERYEEVTRVQYSNHYSWPLSVLLPWQKHRSVRNYLKQNKWNATGMDELYREVRRCCEALEGKLGEQKYFLGDKPSELDAIAYGYLQSILTSHMTDETFKNIIQSFTHLMKLCDRITREYFPDS